MNKVDKIGIFSRWKKTPNTIDKRGNVYTSIVHFDTKNIDKERLIRVYLPSTYELDNPNKRFPVIYMMDGKNLFDDYTSFVGEWGVDETIEEAIKNHKTEGIIVVGIDAPKDADDRALEMIPPFLVPNRKRDFSFGEGYADIFGEYIFKVVKPLIDATFYTLTDKKHTGVGGSSMGGLMAFYLALDYKEYVGFSLCFSPAFFLFNHQSFASYLKERITDSHDLGKIYFYVGGKEFESIFVKETFNTYWFMRRMKYSHDEVKILFDSDQVHNETPWRRYFPDALHFFNFLK